MHYSRTSMGCQEKQRRFVDRRWRYYKKDLFGCESLAESLVSEFSYYIQDFSFVDYYLGKNIGVCYSDSFLKEGESVDTFYRLLQRCGDWKNLSKYQGRDCVEYIVDKMYSITQLNLRTYMSKMLYFDSIILNEDRHFNNLAVVRTLSGFKECPSFDNGNSLLACHDICSFEEINKAKSKPFSTSFKKQIGYFSDCKPLVIDYEGLLFSLFNIGNNLEKYSPHNYKRLGFMISVLKYQLRKMEGVSWVRK